MKKAILKILVISVLSFSSCCLVGAMEDKIYVEYDFRDIVFKDLDDQRVYLWYRVRSFAENDNKINLSEYLKNDIYRCYCDLTIYDDLKKEMAKWSKEEKKEIMGDVEDFEKFALDILDLGDKENLKKEEICYKVRDIFYKHTNPFFSKKEENSLLCKIDKLIEDKNFDECYNLYNKFFVLIKISYGRTSLIDMLKQKYFQ